MQFLEYCSKFCEIVIFTASKQEYADRMLDFLDPDKKFIKYRLFRESCTKIGKAYIKDLSRLGRDLVMNWVFELFDVDLPMALSVVPD